MQRFGFLQPDSLAGVVEALQQYGSEAALLAGGTALLIDIQHGEFAPRQVVSLWGVKRLSEVARNGEWRFGALATMSAIANAAQADPALAGLREAALMVGSRQIQNMATVGGNLCKASPGADLVPGLLCLDATLRLHGPGGERQIPLDGFLTGPDQTALQPAELLTQVHLPPIPPQSGTAFSKIMRRREVDCSIVSVAARVTLSEDGTSCTQARIAIAAAGPNPFRAVRAEQSLEGQPIEPEIARQVGRIAQEESSPVDDVRASAEYRRWLIESLVERTVMSAAQRAKGD